MSCAWVILVIGGLPCLYGVAALFHAPAGGLIILLIALVQTALAWAALSLAAVIGGYIAHRSADITVS